MAKRRQRKFGFESRIKEGSVSNETRSVLKLLMCGLTCFLYLHWVLEHIEQVFAVVLDPYRTVQTIPPFKNQMYANLYRNVQWLRIWLLRGHITSSAMFLSMPEGRVSSLYWHQLQSRRHWGWRAGRNCKADPKFSRKAVQGIQQNCSIIYSAKCCYCPRY